MARKKEPKRADGYYEYKCIVDRTYDDKPIYKSFYSKKSKADAVRKSEEYKNKLQEKKSQPDNVLFEDWARIFLEHHKNKVKASTYLYNYEMIFEKHLIPYFKGRLLKSIIKTDIEDYYNFKLKTLAVSTASQHITRLSVCFAEAIDNGYINYNPCHNLRKTHKSKEKNIYTQEETDLILKYCRTDNFGLNVHIILSYGMSKSEYLGIRLDDVDFESLTVSINKGVTNAHKYADKPVVAETKNKYRNRVIAISQETADYIKDTVTCGFLATGTEEVPSPAGFETSYKAFMRRMNTYYKEQGIDIPVLNLHELRHTRASLWVNQGKNLFAIAEMLGWSDLSMLRKVYGHADIRQLRKELDI